jgi:hypothetical protein
MNNLPDEDVKLTNFLRQHRSIAPPGQPELEDRLMVELDAISTPAQQRRSPFWWQYLAGGIGILITGTLGIATFQIFNSPEPSMAELDGLNLYLEAHTPGLANDSAIDMGKHEDLTDVDEELL